MLEGELLEYVILSTGSNNEDSNESYRWTHADTLVFLDLYETYRKQVGTLRVRNLKKMFEEISKEMKIKCGKNITPTNCENRWRVLERAYKKYILNINQTGGGRKDFEYADIMQKILGKKKNIHPEILLSSDTVDVVVETPETPRNSRCEENESILSNNIQTTPKEKRASKITPVSKRGYNNRILKCQLLKEIRLDRQRYYEKRLAQEDKKIEEEIRRNKLLEERNNILKEISNRIHPLTEGLIEEVMDSESY